MNENTKHEGTRKTRHRKQQRLKKFGFLVIAVIVLSLAGTLLFNAFYKPPLPVAENVIDISADMGGFDKDEIRVKVGELVTIRLRSLDNSHHTDGGGKHQWAVDDFNANVVAPPEGSAMTTFISTNLGALVIYSLQEYSLS